MISDLYRSHFKIWIFEMRAVYIREDSLLRHNYLKESYFLVRE